MKRIKWIAYGLLVLSAVLVVLVFRAPPAPNADFYQCPPGNTLHVCPVGQAPANAECVFVGSGTTTLPNNC